MSEQLDRGGLAAVYPQADWLPLESARAALVLIDLQRLCVAPDRGMFARAAELGIRERMEPYGRRLRELVLPNSAALAGAFRAAGAPVIYTRIRSATPDGTDRGGCHVRLGLHVAPDDPDGDIVAEVAPQDGDLVVDKTTSDAFIGTDLERLLRNLEVADLVVGGVLTNECVSSTVRHAADIGFTVHVVEDACAGVEHDLHEAALRTLGRTYARITSTSQLLEEIGSTP
jgi:nicotinamidase-related amidase